MNKELFNLFVILFPASGIIGGFFHYLMALHFAYKRVTEPLPKWFIITFIANVFITAISGLIILIFYKP